MVVNRSFWYRFETFLIYLGLGLFALIAIIPFLHTIARSFSAEAFIQRGEVYLWPVGYSLDAYSHFVFKQLVHWIQTDFVLLVIRGADAAPVGMDRSAALKGC